MDKLKLEVVSENESLKQIVIEQQRVIAILEESKRFYQNKTIEFAEKLKLIKMGE